MFGEGELCWLEQTSLGQRFAPKAAPTKGVVVWVTAAFLPVLHHQDVGQNPSGNPQACSPSPVPVTARKRGSSAACCQLTARLSCLRGAVCGWGLSSSVLLRCPSLVGVLGVGNTQVCGGF